MSDVAAIAARPWDTIVVGTGMGGATIGYVLAKAGMRVLFCEQGAANFGDSDTLRGDYLECLYPKLQTRDLDRGALLARAGRYWEEVEDRSAERVRKFVPFIGSGSGGSSALYGMALERLFPHDFYPRDHHATAIGAALPERWPISYADLSPYYDAAERLYRVRGERDPLRSEHFHLALLPSPALSPSGHELTDFLQQNGLHPYRLPQACEFVPGCLGCQGYLCAKACKNDSARICLEPSLTQYGAALLDGCEVVRLEANREAVTKVVCVRDGKALTLEAEVVVLAAGALGTPKILLNSDSPEWPRGLANDSGLVGRHLMRHQIDLYAIFPVTRQPFASGNPKEIAFSDFYGSGGEKFGTVQSFGFLPPASMLLASAEEDLRGGGMPWAAVPVNLLRPMLEPALRWMFSGAVVLAAIMEDLPYRGNRVTLERRAAGRATISFNYHINDSDQARLKAFRRKIATVLKPYRVMRIEQAANNQRIAHACGTCRFGLHPNDSVLDGNNKAHGFSNLYVVDASFFPSSGGTNPALTIAANALRVGEHLVRGFSSRTLGIGKHPSN